MITKLSLLAKLFNNYVFCFSYSGIWRCHDIWISEKLKVDISRTKRAFEVKWKTFFLVSKVLSIRHTKQISKNVADTTLRSPNISLCHKNKYQWNCFLNYLFCQFHQTYCLICKIATVLGQIIDTTVSIINCAKLEFYKDVNLKINKLMYSLMIR